MKRGRARSSEAIEFARSQRGSANEFARTVWQWIRRRQICKRKFRREYPIPPYTADFCCVELKLIIEVDGIDHFTDEGQNRDRLRDTLLKEQGYKIVRISGYQVLREGNQTVEMIAQQVKVRMRELGIEAS